jgi:hypothetical protein
VLKYRYSRNHTNIIVCVVVSRLPGYGDNEEKELIIKTLSSFGEVVGFNLFATTSLTCLQVMQLHIRIVRLHQVKRSKSWSTSLLSVTRTCDCNGRTHHHSVSIVAAMDIRKVSVKGESAAMNDEHSCQLRLTRYQTDETFRHFIKSRYYT